MTETMCLAVCEEPPFHTFTVLGKPDVDTIFFDNFAYPVSELYEHEGIRIFFHCIISAYRSSQVNYVKTALDVLKKNIVGIREDLELLKLIQKEMSNFLLYIQPFNSTSINSQTEMHLLLSSWSFAVDILDDGPGWMLSSQDCILTLIDGIVLLFEKYREIFKCGCVQEVVYRLYSSDSGVKFCSLFQKSFISAKEKKPIISHESREMKQVPHCSSSSHFEFFVEMLREFTHLEVIKLDELKIQRFPQILAMLTEIPIEEFSTAVVSLLTFLDNVPVGSWDKRKRRFMLDVVTKVFQFYDDETEISLKLPHEFMSNRGKHLAPLVLLGTMLESEDSWNLIRQHAMRAVSDRLDSGCVTLPIFLLLSKCPDAEEIFEKLSEYLKRRFSNSDKKPLFDIVTAMEQVSDLSGSLRRQLILSLDPSKKEDAEMMIQSLSGLDQSDFEKIDMEKLFKSCSGEVQQLFQAMKVPFEIKSEVIWNEALKCETSASVDFVLSQLKMSLRKRSTEGRSKFQKVLEAVRDHKAMPNARLLYAICTDLFDIREECNHITELSDVNFYIPFALLSVCLCSDSSQPLQNVLTLLRRELEEDDHFWTHFEKDADLVDIILETSTIINSNSLPLRPGNVKYWMKDHLTKHLAMIFPENPKEKKGSDEKNRTASLLGRLLKYTGAYLSEIPSSTGKFADSPFVRVTKTTCDGLVKVYHGTEIVEGLDEIAVEVMKSLCSGSSKNIQSTIFTAQRIRSLVTSIQTDGLLFRRLIAVLDEPESKEMRTEMLKNKEFVNLLDRNGFTI